MSEPHKEPNYYLVFGILTVLTLIELGTTRLPIGKLSIIVLLVGEAVTKAILVAMYFMHLKFEKKTLAMIAFTPIVLCVWLAVMLMPDSVGAKDSVVPMTPAGGAPPAASAPADAPAEQPPAEAPAHN